VCISNSNGISNNNLPYYCVLGVFFRARMIVNVLEGHETGTKMKTRTETRRRRRRRRDIGVRTGLKTLTTRRTPTGTLRNR